MTERERMLAGLLYQPADAELTTARARARRLCRLYNQTEETEAERRCALLTELFAQIGPRVEIEPSFHCDYGTNIYAGDNLYMNVGCVVLDCARVEIGRNAFFGPYVQIYAACHPTDPAERLRGELAKPVIIGDDVWIGGGAIILPGVRIGQGVTIGAGSVVTRDVQDRVVAAGNPCRVLRHL